MDKSQRFLREEIKRLGGLNLIVSSNIPIRKDGGMYSEYMNRKLPDPGVAIYFKYNEKQITMCCDKYSSVWENVYALAKGIEALRGMERWGVSDFLEKAFTGFQSLPESTEQWFDVLGVDENDSVESIKVIWKELVKKYHPDNASTGNTEMFQKVQRAYKQHLNSINNG